MKSKIRDIPPSSATTLRNRLQMPISAFVSIALLQFIHPISVSAVETDAQSKLQSKQFEKEAMKSFQAQHYDAAITFCGKALRADPKNVSALLLRAQSNFRNADFNPALKDTNSALKMEPKNARAFLQRAKTYAAMDRAKEALSDFAASQKLDPTERDVYQCRGQFYLEINKPENAIVDFTKAIQMDPRASDGYRMRSMAYQALNKHDLSAADLGKQIEVSKDSGHLYILRGEEYVAMKDYKRALADFDVAVKTCDTKYKYLAILQRAKLQCNMNMHEKSLADFNTMVSANPMDYETLVLVGTENAHLKRWPQALKAYTDAIGMAPDYAEAFRKRAEVYEKMGKLDRAKKDRLKVEELQKM